MAGVSDALLARLKAWTLELGGPGTRARLEKLTPPRNEYGVDPYGLDVDYVVAAIAPWSLFIPQQPSWCAGAPARRSAGLDRVDQRRAPCGDSGEKAAPPAPCGSSSPSAAGH